MKFTKEEIEKVLNKTDEAEEVCTVTETKVRNGITYLHVVGDQGTDLTYKKETFAQRLASGKIEWIDEEEGTFKVERESLDLWN